ncbi:MAG TPA: hypothetical protein VHD60_02230 [Candidatus Saccharimonadales bacterium]|nr:hypothetical protein [Candidatus Saccharimonadales bacterium]
MTTSKSVAKARRLHLSSTFVSYIILVLAYLILNMVMPISHTTLHRYHIHVTEYRLLMLGIILPLIAIWFSAFYGYERLREYRATIAGTSEAKGFGHIAMGFGWLAWGLPVASIISTIFGGIAVEVGWFHTPAVIVDNYISLAIAVGAFHFISAGTHRLSPPIGKTRSVLGARFFVLFFILLTVSYCYLITQNLQRPHPTSTDPYHIPLWAVLLTLAVPYLYAWFVGLWAALEMNLYAATTRGVFYKHALRYLSSGLAMVVASSIFIQYTSSASPSLSGDALRSILLIIYGLLLVYAAGFALVALGARKLKKIEEV